MKLLINNNEKYDISVMNEKTITNDEETYNVICFNIVNSDNSLAETSDIFNNIRTLTLTREGIDLETKENKNIDFSLYNKLEKIDRRITDEIDSIQIILRQ